MAEFENVEAWNTAVRLAAGVGRLKVASNLKASADAQANAFEQAGIAAGLIAEGAGREGPAQAGLYRDARGALAQCSSWLHVLASVTNQQPEVFGQELELAELASKQVSGVLRTLDRGPRPGGPPAPQPQRAGGPPQRPGGRPGGGGGPR
ncbi:MAG: hypothetical protein IT303_04285 [Dehalococcoidia bacterium]|nr:hypothetical protein [Dehalococcoidia bacterium]